MKNNNRLVHFGGSFNPPGIHHLQLAEMLKKFFHTVLIYPCGMRPDKQTINHVSAKHRKLMVEMTFNNGYLVDTSDIERQEFTRTYNLDVKFRERFSMMTGGIWHVVGADLVIGGASGQSQIQTSWYRGGELWKNANFVVMNRGEKPFDRADLPPHSELLEVNILGSSTEIRQRIKEGKKFKYLVVPEVAEYIENNGLYL